MKNIGRLLETETHQVVLLKTESDQGYLMEQFAFIGGMNVCVSLGFEDKAIRDKEFEEYNSEKADRFIKAVMGCL
jgi:hypothetical protein